MSKFILVSMSESFWDLVKYFSGGYVLTSIGVAYFLDGLSASAYTGLMGKLGGLAWGPVLLYGFIPFFMGVVCMLYRKKIHDFFKKIFK